MIIVPPLGRLVSAGPRRARLLPLQDSRVGVRDWAILDAQAAGYPNVLTLEREGAAASRAESMQGIPKIEFKHLDEYPPAIFRENGGQAAVRPISPRDNMGAGARIGNQLRGVPNGQTVRIKVN